MHLEIKKIIDEINQITHNVMKKCITLSHKGLVA